ASGAKDQQRKLNTVGTECVAEAVDDLALAREHEPGSARRDAYPTHLGGDSGALAPQLDQGVVDLVDALAQAGDLGDCFADRPGFARFPAGRSGGWGRSGG